MVRPSVHLSTIVSPAEATKAIETPFGLCTRVRPKNRALDGVQILQVNGQFRGGRKTADYKVYGLSAASCAKTAEPIEMPCRLGCGLGCVQGSMQ